MPININSTKNLIYVRTATVEKIPWRNSFLYSTMNQNNDYDDYSALDAPTHLSHVLTHFFEQKRNAYKYALAKQHHDEILQKQEFATATRLFKIITGTNLVTNKHVLQYRTAQGMRYLIKKEYAQSVQRDVRNARRATTRDTQTSQPSTDNTIPPSPFVQLMNSKFDDSSSDEDSITPTQDNKPTNPPQNIGVEESKDGYTSPIPTTLHDDNTPSVHSDLTKHAEALEKDMDSAMADLQDPEYPSEGERSNKLETMIQQAVKKSIEPFITKLQSKDTEISQLREQYTSLHDKYDKSIDKISLLQNEYERLNRQLNFVSRTIEVADNKITAIESMSKDSQSIIDSKIAKQFQSYANNKQMTNDIYEIQQFNRKHDKLQRRLTRLKDGTKHMFQQTESDYDLITDRVHRLENDFKILQSQKRFTQKKLSYAQSSDSDSSSFSTPNFQKQQPKFETSTTPTHRYTDTTYYRGPNMDYLRKNVNITCTTQDQILEFYIKLRLAISKGRIHIIQIEDITKDKTIAHRMGNMTTNDLQMQSNALFTLLSNETLIPKEFTMAQNCILGYASTMDGFGALKAMLKLTHPLLSRKRPPNVPPVLSNSTDIHSYEQSLRNFYLLHKLYNDTDYPSIEKAKQFLHGMDDDRFTDAVARVQHQIDTAETLNVDLHEDYNIDNIASTIINITGEYDNNKTVINTLRQNEFPSRSTMTDKRPFTRQHDITKTYTPRRQNQRRFVKTQCHACKQFGHGITHCTLLPKVLAIMQFQRRNSDKCDHVLKQHVMNNTVNSKRTFVRTLMNMDIIPQDDDSDAYLHNDIIVNALIDNDVDEDDVQSQSE